MDAAVIGAIARQLLLERAQHPDVAIADRPDIEAVLGRQQQWWKPSIAATSLTWNGRTWTSALRDPATGFSNRRASRISTHHAVSVRGS